MATAPTHLFDKTIAVTRPAETVDSGGSPIQTFNAHLSGVKCRIQPQRGSENVLAGRPATSKSYTIYVESGLDIEADDRITYGTKTLKIVEPQIDFDEQGILSRIVAEEVSP